MNNKLVTELMELATKHKEVFTERDSGYAAAMEDVCKILSAADEEDIALLAKKKRMYISLIGMVSGKWAVGLCPTNGTIHEYFTDPSYPTAISKARAYLLGLPDYTEATK